MRREHVPKLRNIEIPMSDGARLRGALYVPPRTRRDGKTIIFVHGFAAEKTENGLFPPIGKALAAQGSRVLTYHWRGLGKSDGAFEETTLETHVNDFLALNAWLAGRAWATPSNISAVGFSLGATVVAMALRRNVRLQSVAFLGPALRPSQDMWPRYATQEVQDELTANGFLRKNGVKVGRPLLNDLRDTDLAPDFQFGTNVPLLVCHGTDDHRIPYQTSLRIFNPATEPGVTFRPFIGASHSFRPGEEHWPRLTQVLRDWFAT